MFSRERLQAYQLERLQELLAEVMPKNAFYQELYGCKELKIESLEDWSQLPLLDKKAIQGDSKTDFAAHHTFERSVYNRLHRTSGTRGRPMIVLDTTDDWQWWLDTWQYVWDAAQVTLRDTIFMAFSFGPFIGFWSAFEAAVQRGLKVVPGGGLTTAARLDLLKASGSSVLCCTPTYALHLAEEALRSGIDPRRMGIRTIIVAGEPGGSIPTVRTRIQSVWDATVVDHAGATEVGPWGCGTPGGRDLWVIESEFIAEFLPIEASPNVDMLPNNSIPQLYELVLTSLGRAGAPALRFRTGDIVTPILAPAHRCNFVRLVGGILGRADDMLIIRGVNVFPSSIEAILREFDSVSEFRIIATKRGEMDHLVVEVEDSRHEPHRIEDQFAIQLGLRIEVKDCEDGSLPRTDGKANRFIDQRDQKRS